MSCRGEEESQKIQLPSVFWGFEDEFFFVGRSLLYHNETSATSTVPSLEVDDEFPTFFLVCVPSLLSWPNVEHVECVVLHDNDDNDEMLLTPRELEFTFPPPPHVQQQKDNVDDEVLMEVLDWPPLFQEHHNITHPLTEKTAPTVATLNGVLFVLSFVALGPPCMDTDIFPMDLECPEAVAVLFPLPTVAPVALLSFHVSPDVEFVSTASLELSMPTCVINGSYVPEDLFRTPNVVVPWPLYAESFPLESMEHLIVHPMLPFTTMGPNFAEQVNQMEDEQFIASAIAETQLLSHYQDGGRGDLHHFLALCAEFQSHKDKFQSIEMAPPPPPPPVPAEPVRPASSVKPLSNRKSSISDSLSSLMKIRGAQPKLQWNLKAFHSSDDAVSDRALEQLVGNEMVVLVCRASRSWHPACMLTAAKYVSKKGCSVLWLCENQSVTLSFLDVLAPFLSGIKFSQQIRDVGSAGAVVVSSAVFREPVPDNCLVILSGRSDWLSQQPIASFRLTMVATSAPFFEPFWDVGRLPHWIVLEQPTIPVENIICPLSSALKEAVEQAESQMDVFCGKLASHACLFPPAVSFRMLPLACGEKSMRLAKTEETIAPAANVYAWKQYLNILCHQSLDRARSWLLCMQNHPVYGRWIIQTKVEPRVQQDGEDIVPFPQDDEESALVIVEPHGRIMCTIPTGSTIVSGESALRDPMFPWSQFKSVTLMGSLGECAGDVLEMIRVRCFSITKAKWIVSEYDACRDGVIALRMLKRTEFSLDGLFVPPTVTEVLDRFEHRFDWRKMLGCMDTRPDVGNVSVVVSSEFLKNSADLASSMSTVLQLTLVARPSCCGADIVIDERRAVMFWDITLAKGPRLKDLKSRMSRASLAFEECILIVRFQPPLHRPAAQVIQEITTMCQSSTYRLILSAKETEVELRVIHAVLCVSKDRSTIRTPSSDWLSSEESEREKTLCSLPFISPLVALWALSQFPLQDILKGRDDVRHTLEKQVPVLKNLKDVSLNNYVDLKSGRPISKVSAKLSYVPSMGGQSKLIWAREK